MTSSPPLLLPAGALDALLTEVRLHGRAHVETGGFLLTSRTAPNEVSTLALLGSEGIVRRPGLFVVTAPVIDQLFSHAERNELIVRSLVHSHEFGAFMSKTDTEGTIKVPGFVAAIIPSFAHPPAQPASWGWWTWATATWSPSAPAQIIEGDAAVVRIDATAANPVTAINAAEITITTRTPKAEDHEPGSLL